MLCRIINLRFGLTVAPVLYVGAKPDKQSPFYGDLAMLEVKTVSRKPDEKALPNEIRKLIIENHKVWVNNPLVDKNFV